MPEQSSEDLPPLGERTPAVTGSSRPWYQAPAPVGALCLVLGLVLGAVIGMAVGDGDERERRTEVATGTDTSVAGVATTTSSVATVPPECLDALRSAEQALQLVQQGAQSLRDLRVNDVDRTISDLDQLRRGFSGSVRRCNERLGGSG